MKRLILLGVLESFCLQAEERGLWKWSVVALAASTAADCQSSFGKREMNPLLRASTGRFNVSSVVLKASAMGALVLGQKLISRGRGGKMKGWAAFNFSMAAATSAMAARNYSIRSRQAPPPAN